MVTPKLNASCSSCRERKIKCNGGSPCSHCQRHDTPCTYPPSRRGKRIRTLQGRERSSSNDFGSLRVIPYQTPASRLATREPPTRSAPSRASLSCSDTSLRGMNLQAVANLNTALEDQMLPHANLPEQHRTTPDVHNTLPSPRYSQPSISNATQPLCPRVADIAAEPSLFEDEMSPAQRPIWEHFGPWSWIAVCSPAGTQWVCQKSQSNEFEGMAVGLTKAWSRRLRLSREQVRPQKSPEPDEELAWKYVAAYFDECYDSMFGLIPRPTFESRLRRHFRTINAGEVVNDDDPVWYALRNVVYAAGCRCYLANDPSISFIEAQSRASCLFQNSLSVFTELTFSYIGLTGVRVLAVMSFFAEGLGCPALEYPLCANATQAALAKGLHREPPKSRGLSLSESLSRKWLWWAIYCLEKQLAFRSGRPTLIDDANITATIPTQSIPGTTIDVTAFTILIKHAQISTQISSRIMSVTAFKQSAADLAKTVNDIQTQLWDLQNSLPPELQPTKCPRSGLPSTRQNIGAMYLQCAIYGSLMAVHMIFFYPWMSIRFGRDFDSAFQDQIVASADTLAHAARQILSILRSVETNIAVTSWLSFYYPMYAHINLFVHTLCYPHKETTQADLALLDISAGHFGYVAHATSFTFSFHFPRDTAALAAKVVRMGKILETEPGTRQATPDLDPTGMSTPRESHEAVEDTLFTDSYSMPEELSLDVEAWNIFSFDHGMMTDDFQV